MAQAKAPSKAKSSSKVSVASAQSFALMLLKYILSALMLPVIIGMTIAFAKSLGGLPENFYKYFMWGGLAYLVLYIFVVPFEAMYGFGQKMVGGVFKFLDPLVAAAPHVLPIYSILFLIGFYFWTLMDQPVKWNPYFMFSISFTLAMHLILTARKLREEVAWDDYALFMPMIYIFNAFLIALLLGLIVHEFSFITFFKSFTHHSGKIYYAVFKQLF